MTTEVSLDKVYEEVKRMQMELKAIERSLDSLLESLIPEEEVSPEEVKELRTIEAEVNRGEFVTLEEVKRKYGAKKTCQSTV